MDAISNVFVCLSPKDLLLISSTCKELIGRLNYDHVLRSSLLRGDATHRTSLELIIELCRSGKIYIPSPIRLLRLMNGCRCELPSCRNTQKISDTSEKLKFGLYICSKCYPKGGLNFKTKRDENAWNKILNHDRCASIDKGSKSFIWPGDFSHGGERQGFIYMSIYIYIYMYVYIYICIHIYLYV